MNLGDVVIDACIYIYQVEKARVRERERIRGIG